MNYPEDLNLEEKIYNLGLKGYKVQYQTIEEDYIVYEVNTKNKVVTLYNVYTISEKLDSLNDFIKNYGVK